jgi:hypothetical protein
MLKKISALVVGGLFAALTYSGAARAAGLSGNFVVQASGTAYFYTSPQTTAGQGTTEVLHFSMAGAVSYSNGKNTAANLTLNLGGGDDNSTDAINDTNELTCYLTQPGDLFYTAGTGSTPAMLTVTYQNGDNCAGPNGLPTGGVYEGGDIIPFNFYSLSPSTSGGVIVSNYTYLTNGGTVIANYPHGWKDGGYPDSHVIYGMSATGQVINTSK